MSKPANRKSGDANLPSLSSSTSQTGRIVPVPPSRVHVIGGTAAGRNASGGDRPSGLAFTLRVIRRWWMIAAPVGFLLAAAGCAAIWFSFTPQYEAASWFKIEERTPFLAFESREDDSRTKAFFQTQIEMIRSPLVLGPVVDRPDIAAIPDMQHKSDTVAWLAKQIKVMPVGESELYKILYTSANAASAAAIVNAITDSYFSLRDQSDAERTQKVVDLLEKEKITRLSEVMRMRQDLSDMTRRLTGRDTYSAKPEGDTLQKSTLADLQGRLVAAQVENAVLAARIEAAERESKVKDAGDAAGPAAYRGGEAALRGAMIEKALLERPELAKANDAITAKEIRQKEIEVRMKDGRNDPIYRQLAGEIADDRQALETLKKSLRFAAEKQTDAVLIARHSDRETADSEKRLDELHRLRSEFEGRKVLEQRLQSEHDKEMKNVKQFSGNTLELEFKRDELARAEKVFELISSRALQIKTERLAPRRVTLLRMAETPRAPIEPYPLRLLAAAMLVGLCLPFGLAYGWERMSHRVGGSSDLPEMRNLPVMGEIARMPRRLPKPNERGSGSGETEFRVYRESIDNLQTALTLSADLGTFRVIAVTSAVSGEGKTSVASQLAMSLSRSTNDRVLVIDGDMRSPDIHRVFEIERDPGLAAVLTKQCELADAIVTTWSDRVHLLPAGTVTGNPLGLLADDTWANLLEQIPAEYRYVVVDTPPVLAASEALILAKAADAALICTMRDHSRTEQVMLVQERLNAVGGRLVGIVLNGVPTKSYLYRYGNYKYQENA